MRKAAICLVVILLAWGLCGCGGGGGGGGEGGGDSSAAPAPSFQALKTSQLHTYEPGDQYVYRVSGTYSNSSSSFPMSGTFTIQIMSGTKTDPYNNAVCFDMYRNLSYTIGSNSTLYQAPQHWYVRQLSNGTVLYYGENTGTPDTWVTTPSSGYYTGLASPFALNQTGSVSPTFDDGSTWESTASVGASTADVSVPAGNYEAYVITLVSTRVSGAVRVVENDTQWFVPGIGMVKETVNNASIYSSNVFQYSLSYTASLTSTNVIY